MRDDWRLQHCAFMERRTIQRTDGECGGMRDAVTITLAISVGPVNEKLINEIGRSVVKKRRNTKSQSRHVSITLQMVTRASE